MRAPAMRRQVVVLAVPAKRDLQLRVSPVLDAPSAHVRGDATGAAAQPRAAEAPADRETVMMAAE